MVIADVCISYLLGAVWTLAFESPMLIIEKILFSLKVKHKPKEDFKSERSQA